MNFKRLKPYLFWILLAEAVGLLAGLLTREATAIYGATINKPPLAPPAIVFPIVWTILYALMGVGAARVATSPNRTEDNLALNLFVIQLVVNFFWSFFFFNAQAFGFAALWLVLLWLLVLLMIIAFWRVDKLAAWLQIPYLIWLTFAAYLNFAVYLLN
ncbi:MAG: tryptophan-rich sensory protein [Oscillospiraceae bacterium]|nr:tryptophan-rich sensory protein [Oscillospiraceae bacterium]MBQ9930086.1 tryptophan-rich sensory protein [Oscillospiraceae bacterium]